MPSTPTIVFVPGTWHGPETWDTLSAILRPQGYKCVSVELPSTTPDENPHTATFLGDKEAVRAAIVAETTSGRDVVVVSHSYGSLPGCSGVQGLTLPKKSHRSSTSSSPATAPATDRPGSVIGIALIATGLIPSGVTFLGALGGTPLPEWRANRIDGLAEVVADPVDFLYHDLPPDEAQLWRSRLRKHALASLDAGGEHVHAGWLDVPVWYLSTLLDRGVRPEAQKMAVQAARDAGADIAVREVEAGHSVMLSRPQETAAFVVDAVADFVKRAAA